MTRPTPHVALIVETASHYGRELLGGVTAYLRANRPWSVYLEQTQLDTRPPAWLDTWDGDGAIVRTTDPDLLARFARQGVPVVDVSDRGPAVGLPRINSDDADIGRQAADHLLERGYRQFAFCGFAGELWSDRRRDGFAGRLRAAGHDCEVRLAPWNDRRWEAEQNQTADWLRGRLGPLAVLACNDLCGLQVVDAARRAGLGVPDQVAVVGVDDDPVICGLCDPPLSSVRPDPGRVGYLAAEWLDTLMNGRPLRTTEAVVPARGVTVRPSSDVLAVTDPTTATAARFIRDRACQGVTVDDVVRHAGVSRSDLERRFRRQFGRSPHDELQRVRLNRVRQLLRETDLKAADIAAQVGFAHPEYLCVFFKRLTGQTLGGYRKAADAGSRGS